MAIGDLLYNCVGLSKLDLDALSEAGLLDLTFPLFTVERQLFLL